jgi:WD40 repeat protein/serine/threonine protein kinase
VNEAMQHLLTIFSAALECASPQEQRTYLDRACAGNAECRARVETLLRAHEQAGNFLQGEQPTTAPGPQATDTVAGEIPGASIGPYKLVRELGEGGMGTVWLAEQQEPVQRQVALKVIKPGMDSRQVIARFEAERQALALMDHPNIAKVHDAGTTANSRPYFVMELVQGVPLTRYCDEQRLTPRQRLELFIPVCQAVQHAHQKGIIHRDLKPSNVLVTLYDGRPVPKVIDFGIAKATGQLPSEHSVFTQVGQVVGTLEYMSPEQAELNPLDIDTRSDVYSLGVILYELLTGSTPLQRKRVKQAAMLEVLRLIREEEPPTPSARLSKTDELPSVAARRGLEPRKLSGLMRGELDWVVMKALEKDRNCRYESANGLAQDLERYLHDEPVAAGPPSASYRLKKFLWRNRGPVLAAGVVLLVLVGGIIGTTVGLVQAEQSQRDRNEALRDKLQEEKEKNEANGERIEALAGKAKALEGRQRAAYRHWLALIHNEYEANHLTQADEMLDSATECPEKLRGWEWHYLKRLCPSELSHFQVAGGRRYFGWNFTSDGSRLAVFDKPFVRLYDTVTGKETGNFNHSFLNVREVTLSPDGRLLATSTYYRWYDMICLWDATTGANLARLYGQKTKNPTPDGFCGTAFSPDGRLLAGTDMRGNLFVWDLAAGWWRLHTTPAGLVGQMVGAPAAGAAGGPLGSVFLTLGALAAANADPVAPHDFQDVFQGRLFHRGAEKPAEPPFPLRFQVLAHPSDPRPSAVWHTKPAFSPNGELLATASADGGEVKLWDPSSGKEVGSLGKAAGFSQVVFSRSGKWVAAIGSYGAAPFPDQAVWVWDARTRQLSRVLVGKAQRLISLAFSPDEQLLSTGSREGILTLWDLRLGLEASSYRGNGPGVYGVMATAFSPDGKRVLALAEDGLRTWDATRRPEYRALPYPGAEHAVFSSDSRLVAAACLLGGGVWGTVVRDAETGQELARWGPRTESAYSVALSPDGRFVAAAVSVGTLTGAVRIWDVGAGQIVHNRSQRHTAGQLVGAEAVALAATPGAPPLGPTLVRLGMLVGAQWDFSIGPVHSLPGEGLAGPCYAVAWSPDGRLIASGGQDRIVRIWDAAQGTLLRELGKHARTISAVAFSRDGQRLVSASGGITRTDTPPNRPLELPRDNPEDIPDVKVWDLITGKELRSWSFPEKGPGLALSPDGETVAVTFGKAGRNIFRAIQLDGGANETAVMQLTTLPDVVRLYSVASGEELAVLKGHTRPPWCVAFSPDGKRIVTGTDNTIKLWDPATGEEILTVGRYPGGQVTSVAFSPDGMKIVSTNNRLEVRIWDATPLKK